MLNLNRYFKVSEKIQMDYMDKRGHLIGFTSQVVEVHGNEFIDVLIPIHKNEDVYLEKETIVKLIVQREGAVYEFRAVLSEKLFGRIPLLRFKILSEINKIQRRDFYRLKLMRETDARVVLNIKERKYGEKFKCTLHDISAGGLLFSSNKQLEEKDLLEFTLDLNGKKLIVFGIIIRRSLAVNSRMHYIYGVKYDRMSEFERNEINKFIFEEQRRLIKKGLI
ncbi:MAG TPA: PilZ domain-containing protein [Clostridia bacterium]|nr:PilZ domain-containing protein [Clostridia bacterium]